MRVLMIGCGNMGASLLTRWVELPGTSFSVVDPATNFSDPRVKIFRSADSVEGDAFDLLIIAVKPQMIADVMPAYLKLVRVDAPALSIAAGVSCARLESVVGSRPIIRVMPNLPAKIGKGVSGIYFNANTSDAEKDKTREMMRAAGAVVEVDDEDGLDRVTAIAGSGPGYVFEIARAYVEAAKKLGFGDEQARTLVLGTLAGAVEMAAGSTDDLADMRNAVTSKAGTTEAGLKALNGDGTLSKLMEAATQAAYERAVELR
jgi:pyrroline-5-carboxylate reductase